MKYLIYAAGGFLFCIALLCVSLIPFATGYQATEAVQGAAAQAAAAPTPTSIPAMDAGELREILSDLEAHDERMTDKVVQVAVSGDKAQTITAVSADWAGAALPCLLGVGMVAAIGLLLSKKSGD